MSLRCRQENPQPRQNPLAGSEPLDAATKRGIDLDVGFLLPPVHTHSNNACPRAVIGPHGRLHPIGNHQPPTMTSPSPPPDINLTNPPFPLTSIDRALLATPDEDFHRITWPDLQRIITANTLEDLKRLPSDLKRYLAWSHATKAQYGSITSFVIRERLRWTPLPGEEGGPPRFEYHNPVPFADTRDYAVLKNDWPYGLAPGILHLLVWSKTPIPVDADRGDVTPESRKLIVDFVERFFVRAIEAVEGGDGWEKVQWFKNWVSLQSVRGVDHVHVLVRDVDEGVVEGWTRRTDL